VKLTDYVVNFLSEQGIKYVFGLTGGAVVHLFDSLEKHPNIKPIFNHHEQASALAAEAYARVRNNIGAAFVTTGPGGTNAITGVLAAWMDSVPCIFISGQARIEQTSRGKQIRQLGSQEFDIVSLITPITKYTAMIDDPQKIKYHLQKAVYLAKSGRPGPVWIDIPLNIQWSQIDADKLPEYLPKGTNCITVKDKQLKQCIDLLSEAKRPLILAGYGIRLANAVQEFKIIIKKFRIPYVSSWNASDLLPTDDPLYVGRIGVMGQRGGNLAVQNCDCLLALGSHLSLPLTGTNVKAFAREAKKIIVDIDPVELDFQKKFIDLPILSDVKSFLSQFLKKFKEPQKDGLDSWRERCLKYKAYNMVQKDWKKPGRYVNPYVFVDLLSDHLTTDDVIVVDGGGTALFISFQGSKIKAGQRLIVSAGIAAMGTGLPESIGACFANKGKRVICMTGDGSLQFNIQELQTIVHHRLPIKIFVFNNSGYLAIRHTQRDFLSKRYVGSCKAGGVSLPDFQKIANAYGIRAIRIYNNKEMHKKVKSALNDSGPVLCEIMISPDQQLIPRVGFNKNADGTFSSRPLEDMAPYLGRKEFTENMMVKPWDRV